MTVLVVCGCVPEGDALGNGVIVAVGSGEDSSGLTVVVGRGPAGMLGLGIAFNISSLGDSARPASAAPSRSATTAALAKILITNTSCWNSTWM